jgi:hypothetical protein
MLILNFTCPLRCLRVPPGVRVPPVEYHWSKGYKVKVIRCFCPLCGYLMDAKHFILGYSRILAWRTNLKCKTLLTCYKERNFMNIINLSNSFSLIDVGNFIF